MTVLQTTMFKLLKPHRGTRVCELLCDVTGTTASSWCLWWCIHHDSRTRDVRAFCQMYVLLRVHHSPPRPKRALRTCSQWHASVDRFVLRAHPVFMCIVIFFTGTLVEVQSVVHKTGAVRTEIATQLTAECAMGRGHSSEQQRPQCMGEMVQELGVDWRTNEFGLMSRGHR